MAMPFERDHTNTAWIANKARQFSRFFSDTYRPELHYMRGPGPKWRERQARQAAQPHTAGLGLSNLGNAGAYFGPIIRFFIGNWPGMVTTDTTSIRKPDELPRRHP